MIIIRSSPKVLNMPEQNIPCIPKRTLHFSLDYLTMLEYLADMKAWLPDEIRDFRKLLGMTQRQFANMIGVSGNYVYYLEGGERKPSKTLKILLNYLEKEQSKRR